MGNKNIKDIRKEGFDEPSKNVQNIDKPPQTNDPSLNENNNFKIVRKHNKELEDSSLIEQCLMKHFFFRVLEKQARMEIIKELSLSYMKKGTILFNQGNSPNYFYLIKEGQVELLINGIKTNVYSKGESFGEQALMFESPRKGTLKAVTDTYMYIMERKNFKKIIDHILHLNFEDNKKFLTSLPVLNMIEHEQKNKLINSFLKQTYEENIKIINKGEISPNIYFIQNGEVEVRDKDKIIKVLKKGDYFGEREILINSLRTHDVITKTKCVLFSISAASLFKIFGEKYQSMIFLSLIKTAILKTKNLKKFNIKLIENVFDCFKAKFINKSEQIIYPKNFNTSSKMIIDIDGDLKNDKGEIISNRGQLLFEDDLLNNTFRKIDYNIINKSECLLIEGDMEKILKIFGCSLKEQLDKSSVIDSLRKVNLFKTFTTAKLENLSQKIKIEKIPQGKNVITQGEEGTRFYIIKSGLVDIYVGKKYIRTMNENEYLGERALFFKEPRSATATAKNNVEVFYLDKEDFVTVIETNLKDYLLSRLYLQDNTVQLNDLIFYDVLGSGNYGQVSLVKNKKNNFYYAIKNISCKQILYS